MLGDAPLLGSCKRHLQLLECLLVDLIGVSLNVLAPVLFAIAATFSGTIWQWGSGASIAMWVLCGCTTIIWILQQTFSILTTPKQRAFQ